MLFASVFVTLFVSSMVFEQISGLKLEVKIDKPVEYIKLGPAPVLSLKPEPGNDLLTVSSLF